MGLSPERQIIAAALDVLASVSKQRLRLAVSQKRQSSVLVDPFAFGRLATKMEEFYPGAIAQVYEARMQARNEYIRRERKARDEIHAAYLEEQRRKMESKP